MKNVPLMEAPGFDIEPFMPPLEWIESVWTLFCAGETRRDGGLYSFSKELHGVYRIPTMGFNYGLSAGAVLDLVGPKVGWQCEESSADGIPVVSCYFENMYVSERVVDVMGSRCRAVCVEPWANTFNIFYIWLGKHGLTKGVYDHDCEEWIS